MELIFDHTVGKQEDQDLVFCRPLAQVEPEEENDALERGWLALDNPINDQEVFYQSRSTRVSLEDWEPKYKSWKIDNEDIRLKHIEANELVKLLGLPNIYKQYMKRKGFKMDYDPFATMNKRDSFLIFYIKEMDNIIGFTKLKSYMFQEDAFGRYTHQLGDEENEVIFAAYESCLHCNLQPISQITLDMEIKWAKDRDAQHFYLGSGYEASSSYKSKQMNFEWWTGTYWSKSKKQFQKLCRSDSRATTLQDVSKIPSLLSRT